MAITTNTVFNADADSRQFTISVTFLVPLIVDVKPILKADFPFTIDNVIARTESGSHQVAIGRTRNGVGANLFVGNITVSDTTGTHVPTGNNNFIVDDMLVLSYSNLNNPQMSSIQINCTRDYTQ